MNASVQQQQQQQCRGIACHEGCQRDSAHRAARSQSGHAASSKCYVPVLQHIMHGGQYMVHVMGTGTVPILARARPLRFHCNTTRTDTSPGAKTCSLSRGPVLDLLRRSGRACPDRRCCPVSLSSRLPLVEFNFEVSIVTPPSLFLRPLLRQPDPIPFPAYTLRLVRFARDVLLVESEGNLTVDATMYGPGSLACPITQVACFQDSPPMRQS